MAKVALTEEVAQKFKFMSGTESTSKFLVLARRGNIGLGIRVLGITDGAKLAKPGTSYIHARLRSAKLPSDVQDFYDSGNVVNIGSYSLEPDEAWPGVTFDKTTLSYSSTVVGVFAPGNLTPEQGLQTLDNIENGNYIDQLVSFVLATAPSEFHVVRKKDVEAFAWDSLAAGFAAYRHAVKKQEINQAAATEFAKQVEAAGGSAGFHAAQMKAVFTSLHGVHKYDGDAGDGGESDYSGNTP